MPWRTIGLLRLMSQAESVRKLLPHCKYDCSSGRSCRLMLIASWSGSSKFWVVKVSFIHFATPFSRLLSMLTKATPLFSPLSPNLCGCPLSNHTAAVAPRTPRPMQLASNCPILVALRLPRVFQGHPRRLCQRLNTKPREPSQTTTQWKTSGQRHMGQTCSANCARISSVVFVFIRYFFMSQCHVGGLVQHKSMVMRMRSPVRRCCRNSWMRHKRLARHMRLVPRKWLVMCRRSPVQRCCHNSLLRHTLIHSFVQSTRNCQRCHEQLSD